MLTEFQKWWRPRSRERFEKMRARIALSIPEASNMHELSLNPPANSPYRVLHKAISGISLWGLRDEHPDSLLRQLPVDVAMTVAKVFYQEVALHIPPGLDKGFNFDFPQLRCSLCGAFVWATILFDLESWKCSRPSLRSRDPQTCARPWLPMEERLA